MYRFTNCNQCNKEFRYSDTCHTGKYCSYACYWQAKKGDSKCANNFGEYAQVGNDLVWNKDLKGYKAGKEHWCYGKKRPELSGKKHFNWRGGKAKDKRTGADYIHWRSDVFERDNWTCQTCGDRGGYLHAHHIKRWAEYPELRFVLDNGVALCIDCHKLTDNYCGKRG